MMKRIALILFLSIFGVAPAIAKDDVLAKANALYEQKSYQDAEAMYAEILAQNVNNAAVNYDMGNTQFRLNQVGKAVLYYRQALRRDPDNKLIQDNLRLTENRIPNRIVDVGEIFFLRKWEELTHESRSDLWAYISLGVFLAILGFFVVRIWNRSHPIVPAKPAIAAAAIMVVCLIFAFTAAHNKAIVRDLVVMQSDTPFYQNANTTGKPLSLLPEGTTLSLLSRKGDIFEVSLPDSRHGYVSASLAAPVQ